jgi:uncharacterized protein YgfB (UPF0149 family)
MSHAASSLRTRLLGIFAVLAVCVLPLAAQEIDECFQDCHDLGMLAYGDDQDYEKGSAVFEECMETFCGGM